MDLRRTVLGALLALSTAFAGGARADGPDPRPWAGILEVRVDDRGLVDYAAIARFDAKSLGGFLGSLARVDPESLGEDDAIAFWLNAYNALVVLGITHGHDPERLEDRARLYHWLELEIGGRSRTLDEIREILGEFAVTDPRIHFAACNGTLGSPPLAREPYEGERIDAQLARAARVFANDPRWNRIDVPSRRAELSPLFRWYREDFERAAGSIRAYVAERLPDPKIASILRREEMAIEFAPFDWRKNERPAHAGAEP